MRRWFEVRPSLRVAPTLALVTAVILLIAGGAMAYYEDNFYRSQKTEEVRVQGDILASGVMAALIFSDSRAAQEYVSAMKVNPELEAVGVYADKGAAVAGFVRPSAAALPTSATAGPPTFVGNRLIVVQPVLQGKTLVGTVYLRALTETFQRRLARYGGILLLVIMGALVLVVFATAQTALSRANSTLEDRARDLADANLRLQIEMEERGKAEEALRQSQKMEAIGQLSGGIAHDFNNLLSIVMGNLQLLQRRAAQGRTDTARFIESSMEGVKRAAALTQRLLAFSRRQPLSPKPVNLSQLSEGMIELIRHSVGERARMDLRLESDWMVLCDANQMENVILNLAINARDAMPEGGTVVIATKNMHLESAQGGFESVPLQDYVQLTVSDNGVGMSAEIREKAIDPFFTTKPMGQGTGLGLSTTFGYIRQSGGYMHIESEPGEGTIVTILMPRFAGAEKEEAA